MAAYNATGARQGRLRRQLLEELLGAVGVDVEIRPPLFVGAGAVVTRELPPNVVAVGNPARVLRRL